MFGTPKHIAPEILENRAVVVQSDSYSFGVSLEKCLDRAESNGKIGSRSSAPTRNLRSLCKALQEPDYIRRPRYLLQALRDHDIIDGRQFESSQKTLLAAGLLNSFRVQYRASLKCGGNLSRFLERNRVFGLSEELITALDALLARAPLATYRILRDCVRAAEIRRAGDYWLLKLPDEFAAKLYRFLDGEPARYARGWSDHEIRNSSDPGKVLKRSILLRRDGRTEKAYLLLSQEVDWRRLDYEGAQNGLAESVLRELSDQAIALNRQGEAAEYLEKVNEILDSRQETDFEVVYRLAMRYLLTGRSEPAARLIRQTIDSEADAVDSSFMLNLRRLDGLLMKAESDTTIDEYLEDTAGRARKLCCHDVAVLCTYNRGVRAWSRGDFVQANKLLIQALEEVEDHGVDSQRMTVLSVLSMLSFETGGYEQALKYGRLASRLEPGPRDRVPLGSVILGLCSAYIRLGLFQKADYWLQRYLGTFANTGDSTAIAGYYAIKGFLKLNSGELESAEDAYHRALEIIDDGVGGKSFPKAMQWLAEIALYRGQGEECDRYLDQSRQLFRDLHDDGSVAEIDLVAILNRIYNRGEDCLPELSQNLVVLEKNQRWYFSALTLFHIMLLSRNNIARDTVVSSFENIWEKVSEAGAPLFRAMLRMKSLGTGGSRDGTGRIPTLKEAYTILEKGGQRFLAMLLCCEISRDYGLSRKHKLARKYCLRAISLAEALNNERQKELLVKRMGDAGEAIETGLVDSIYHISEVLNELDNYEDSLKSLVQFAVDETGAERGVLLIKRELREELQVIAYVNCDEESLTDIQSISSNIPTMVTSDEQTMLIDNAVVDARTRNCKSILMHNILSVVCTPIIHDGALIGALYLDHHAIPSLFAPEDITYIKAIANFIARVLPTIRKFRGVRLTLQQMQVDIHGRGRQFEFVTVDPHMKELLTKLPEIARSPVPVLILGESGTGKEILAHLIHDFSLRREMPLLKMNCAAIAGTLIESELFGIAKHVATGVAEREGKFSAADGGTLLLDEIGDMPVDLQPKLLRVAEYQEFEKVGSNRRVVTDVRLVYSSNRDLKQMISDGTFRRDLYYRISTIKINIPPLRERRDDIPVLIDYFFGLFGKGRLIPRLTETAMRLLVKYDWPGNVRELRNLVERWCIIHAGESIGEGKLPKEIRGAGSLESASFGIDGEDSRSVVVQALERTRGNKAAAARFLGWSRSRLIRKIKKFGIEN